MSWLKVKVMEYFLTHTIETCKCPPIPVSLPGAVQPWHEEHDEPADPEPGGGGSPLHTCLCPGNCERLCPHVSTFYGIYHRKCIFQGNIIDSLYIA